MTDTIKNIEAGNTWQTQTTNYVPALEHPLKMWYTSDITQCLAQLESNPPYALLDIDRARKLTMINAPTAPQIEDPGNHQILGYQGQQLQSGKTMTWPIDTPRHCMSDMMSVDFKFPFKTINAPGNSRHKETNNQHAELGRWSSILSTWVPHQTKE